MPSFMYDHIPNSTNPPTDPPTYQDIWAVRKTWVGALSLFSRRRVLRGAGPYREPGTYRGRVYKHHTRLPHSCLAVLPSTEGSG